MTRLANGGMEFQITGPAGTKRVEVSNDLIHWTTEWLVGPSTATLKSTTDGGPRFFRAVLDNASSGDFPIAITARASAEITIRWDHITDATATRIFLAAEPEAAAAPNPARVLLASLTGSATNFTATNLAAAVDCFFRVEIETPGGTKAALLHGRTAGGPRAPLQSRLREVHGYAPNVLCVTLLNGPTNSLKDGWAVKRSDGRPVPIAAVHRHSVPVSTSDYPLGWRCCGTIEVTETDHRIYLVLSEPIGNAAVLEIAGPEGLRFTLPFSDRYLETPVIQINQVGYNPRATQRWAYISGWMGDGGGLSLSNFPTQAEVLMEPENSSEPRTPHVTALAVTSRSPLDPMAGTPVHEINLANLPASETARYRVRVPGVGVSWRTTVSEKAAFKIFYTVARGLFHNRWGGDLRSDLTEWSRPSDHPFVFTNDSTNWFGTPDGGFPFESTTPRIGQRPLAGGHHDAGDFDIRPFHTRVAQLLLRAYEIDTNAFADHQLNLPESGNGIPDLLDEALWSIAAWEQLQEEDGGVRLGVESYRHPHNQGILANEDRDEDNGDNLLPYWTYGRDANHSARCAGLFAQAARLIGPFNTGRSEILKQRALNAWHYATNHNAFGALRLYPAGELFRLTGDNAWHAQFDSIWRSLGATDEEVSHLANSKPLNPSDYATADRYDPDHVLAYLGAAPLSEPKAQFMRNLFYNSALNAIEFAENEDKEAHRNPHPWAYSVGFGQSISAGTYFWNLYAAQQLGLLDEAERARAFDSLSLAADYILGGNPNGMVYITGLGTRRIMEPLHLDSLAFIKLGKGPVPGIPVYGPVDGRENQGYAARVMEAFYPEVGDDDSGSDHSRPATSGHPIARRHADTRIWVNANEFSVAEMQAPHAQLFALLMMGTQGTLPPPSYRPGGSDHRNPLP